MSVAAEYQTPPEVVGTNMPKLSNLLEDNGKKITTEREWLQHRAHLKRLWQEFLGPLPEVKAPLQAQVKRTENLNLFSRSYVVYQVEPGVVTDGYLLCPKGVTSSNAVPAVVVFHPTTPLQARGVAGLEPDYDAEKQQGVQLVKRGFVVWCPRNYINTEGMDWSGNARKVKAAHTNWTGMTRMVWDAIRAVDYLETLPQVDRRRIGCLGHSLGAKVVLYAMAFDERYKAGVASEGGIGLTFSNWEADWYLGSRIREEKFSRENHEILALIAPRAFLLLAGDSADDSKSWAFIHAVLPVYQLLHASGNVGWLDHHKGHRYPPEARVAAEEFLSKHLSE
jgi:dienelactone hydrolase